MADLAGFTVVEKSSAGVTRSEEIAVTIKDKCLFLSAEAMRQLGKPARVTVMHNPTTKEVAVVPTTADNFNSYSLHKSGQIACTAFLRHINPQAGRVGGRVVDGVMIFSLTTRPDLRPRVRQPIASN